MSLVLSECNSTRFRVNDALNGRLDLVGHWRQQEIHQTAVHHEEESIKKYIQFICLPQNLMDKQNGRVSAANCLPDTTESRFINSNFPSVHPRGRRLSSTSLAAQRSIQWAGSGGRVSDLPSASWMQILKATHWRLDAAPLTASSFTSPLLFPVVSVSGSRQINEEQSMK